MINNKFVLFFGLLTSTTAYAWECDLTWGSSCTGCQPWLAGSSAHYALRSGAFTTAQQTALIDADTAWSAGSGDLVRGASWHFLKDADEADFTFGDGDNTVSMQSTTWWTSQGLPSNFLAATFDQFTSCAYGETDIAFNAGFTWTTSLPGAAAAGTISVGQVFEHELGHWFGADHEQDFMTLMNGTYPNGGDLSAAMRLHEDEADLLRDIKSGASTGQNLAIGKFEDTGTGTSAKGWTNTDMASWDVDAFTADIQVCPGDEIAGSLRPAAVYVNMIGTGTASSVPLKWFFKPVGGNPCGQSGNVQFETLTLTMTMDNPSYENPFDWTVPGSASITAGDYKICAVIDLAGAVTETSEGDNSMASEATVEVLNATDSRCL